ncbi:polysaccharide deacetylase family protein [Flavobacterium sp.]|uniref:polysaccharide deacetylase family protein n=1 Tax=Flavobacterium sp. TaxID=239 RepID=UPI00286E5B90|nr:polysaccharide deacetylase family protein [Flavobacterium sp.]
MTRFLQSIIIPYLLLFCVLFISCKGTKDKISSKAITEKRDSLQLIQSRSLEQEKLSNEYRLDRGKNGSKVVAFTFDDGPTNLSNEILDVLNKNNVKATFFWLGINLAANKEIIIKAKKSGHQIANHSWDHTNGYELDENLVWEQQVLKTIAELKTVAGIQSNYYRPPFGAITQKQIDFLGNKGITTVLWSITTMDWDITQNDGDSMLNTFTAKLHPGAIVLMHDKDFGKSDEKLVALENMILYAKSQGYTFVTIEKMK